MERSGGQVWVGETGRRETSRCGGGEEKRAAQGRAVSPPKEEIKKENTWTKWVTVNAA